MQAITAVASRPSPFESLTYGGRSEELEARSHITPPTVSGSRIKINVRGLVFETYEQTLAQYPETLLGSPEKLLQFYNPHNDEYCFDRDKSLFDIILFFYQSSGILACPEHVPRQEFLEEIKFFRLDEADRRYKQEMEPEQETVKKKEEDFRNVLQRKIWSLFEYPDSSKWANILGKFSVLVIIMSTITFCIETLPSLRHRVYKICHENKNERSSISNHSTSGFNNTEVHCITEERGKYWFTIEAVYVTWFTFEYLMRLFSSPNKRKFVTSPLGLVDFVAILPYYITLIVEQDSGAVTAFPVLRIIRLLRVIRILKLSRYSKGLKVLARTLMLSAKDLPSLLAILTINIVLFSSIIYYVENDIKETDFSSIPDAFWWSVITMTTVGYGDQVPKGALGKLVGAMCAISGMVVLFCFPTPVLLSHFEEMYSKPDGLKGKAKEKEKEQKNTKGNQINAATCERETVEFFI